MQHQQITPFEHTNDLYIVRLCLNLLQSERQGIKKKPYSMVSKKQNIINVQNQAVPL